jgi:predicted  nucleic acid-binding Zn-ribbon protein
MKGEKITVEQALAFDLERETIKDQTREMAAFVRELQGEVGRLRAENDRLKRYCEEMETECEQNRADLGDQIALFQAKMSEMMTNQREERGQWEQQRSSTLQRIRALEGELQLTAAENRRALDTYVSGI